jgi:hypothetical protein
MGSPPVSTPEQGRGRRHRPTELPRVPSACEGFLPTGTRGGARGGAFPSAGTLHAPPARLRALVLSGGPDHAWREGAGTLTRRAARRTAPALWKRRPRWTPCLITWRPQRWALAERPAWPQPRRFLACDGTPGACPGAPRADSRLPLPIQVGPRPWPAVRSGQTKQGERLQHAHLHAGAVALVARGEGASAGRLATGWTRPADVLGRGQPPRPRDAPPEHSQARDGWAARASPPPGPRRRCAVSVP